MKTLERCENMFGKMSPMQQREIKKYIKNPTFDQWDEIAHYIVNPAGQITTIWQAVLTVDSTFPNRGRTTDIGGNIIREWERIPEPFTVLQAIRYATGE